MPPEETCEKGKFVNGPFPNAPWCLEHDEAWEGCYASLRGLLEEASSLLLSIKINLEKRSGLTVVERELLDSVRQFVAAHPPPGGDV